MGQRRQKQERFFGEHLFCCFCGGQAPATTIDHVPNRASFPGRASPEGFEFPACKACNDSTRLDEIAFSVMVHLANSEDRNVDHAVLRNLLTGLQNNLPALAQFEEMTLREKRVAARELDMRPYRGMALSEAMMVRLPEEFGDYIHRYLRKLAKAIYYQHLGLPMPSDMVAWALWTHGQIGANRAVIAKWEAMTPIEVKGKRSNIDFGNRFRYRVNYSADMPALAAVGQFGDGLIFYALCVSADIAARLDSEAFQAGVD